MAKRSIKWYSLILLFLSNVSNNLPSSEEKTQADAEAVTSYPPLSTSAVNRSRRQWLAGGVWRRRYRVSRRWAESTTGDGHGAAQGLAAVEELPLLSPESQHAGLQVQAVAPALLQGVLPPLERPVVGDDLGKWDAKCFRRRFWGKRKWNRRRIRGLFKVEKSNSRYCARGRLGVFSTVQQGDKTW